VTPVNIARLRFLARVIDKECRHLETTDRRLFADSMTVERAESLAKDTDLAERVEAFVGRFGRLQDTLADKLLPALLAALGEPVSAQIDNLDRAERLGWIDSTDQWMTIRQLRNQMVHEYMEDMAMLASALQSGHNFVTALLRAANGMTSEIGQRGWTG
jgi:hypothetical protein